MTRNPYVTHGGTGELIFFKTFLTKFEVKKKPLYSARNRPQVKKSKAYFS